jgi:hypothetical protein
VYTKEIPNNKGDAMARFTVFYEQLVNFYNDIGFMAALFYNNVLDNVDIYEIANHLNSKTYDDVLTKIIANGADSNTNQELFKNYLNAIGIKSVDYKRAAVAKVFYYILHNKIDFDMGIRFISLKIIDDENAINYVGDDVGIEQIIGNYYSIDGETDEKDIKIIKKEILEEMRQYIRDNLMEFPIKNNGIRHNGT